MISVVCTAKLAANKSFAEASLSFGCNWQRISGLIRNRALQSVYHKKKKKE
jgi:hypothetical protein